MSNTQAVAMHTGATVDGVQREAEVLMRRHTPADWPTLANGLNRWEALIKDMDAKDFEVNLRSIAMNPVTGGLFNKDKDPQGQSGGIVPTRTSLGHLLSYDESAPPQAVTNLEAYSPAVRAQMLAERIARGPIRKVFMRTAVKGIVGQSQERVIRAVVTGQHSKDFGDDLVIINKLRTMQNLPGAVLRVVKQWDSTHAEIVIPNKVIQPKVGVVIQARMNVWNSETKAGAIGASIGALNLTCLNGNVGAGNGTTINIRHNGDVRYKVNAALATVVELADDVLHDFSEAYKALLPVTQAEAIAQTVKRYQLPETTGAALQALWDVDGERSAGHTVAGLANALTRHAQSLPVERALDLETIAGKVISKGIAAFA